MRKTVTLLVAALCLLPVAQAQTTLDYCLTKADANYPLIRKYDLVARTGELSLSDINKGWLPRIGVYGQATVQNVVPSFPDALKSVLTQFGQDMKGLGHVQYKAGIDLTQTIWDGGLSKSMRRIERAGVEESAAALDVQIYAMHEKVEELFFSVLLIDEQIARTQATLDLLGANHARLAAMVRNGVALPSDADMVEAQMLTLSQQLAEARSAARSYRSALELYVGESLEGKSLVRPVAAKPADLTSRRPELQLYDSRLRLNEARAESVNASVMPRIGLFAQAYYGYPGLNYFESMMNRNMSFNLLAGVKVSWTIDAFYTKKNSRGKLALAASGIETDREQFLFNSCLQTQSQLASIEALEEVMKSDARIVELCGNVRRAAEAQLENGVIDTATLLAKITDENRAQLTARYHEIQLLQTIYQLKHTLNR